jgi:hypothetical protein
VVSSLLTWTLPYIVGAYKAYLILGNNVAEYLVEVLVFHIFLVGNKVFIDYSGFSIEYIYYLLHRYNCLYISLEADVDIGKTNNLSNLCNYL